MEELIRIWCVNFQGSAVYWVDADCAAEAAVKVAAVMDDLEGQWLSDICDEMRTATFTQLTRDEAAKLTFYGEEHCTFEEALQLGPDAWPLGFFVTCSEWDHA